MRIKKGVSWSKTENGLMLVHPVNDQCLVLNESGEIVWNVLTESISYNQVVEKVCRNFDLSQHEIIKEDIRQLLEVLKNTDLIEGDIYE